MPVFHSGPMHIWNRIQIFILRTLSSKWRVLAKGPMRSDLIIFLGISYDVGQRGGQQVSFTLSTSRIDAGGLDVSGTSREVLERNWRNQRYGIMDPDCELSGRGGSCSPEPTCFWHKQSDGDWRRDGADTTSKGEWEVKGRNGRKHDHRYHFENVCLSDGVVGELEALTCPAINNTIFAFHEDCCSLYIWLLGLPLRWEQVAISIRVPMPLLILKSCLLAGPPVCLHACLA